MKSFLALLLVCLTGSAHALTVAYTPGTAQLCIVVADAAHTKEDFVSEGSGADAGLYTYDLTGLVDGTYTARVYAGVNAASVVPATDENKLAFTVQGISIVGGVEASANSSLIAALLATTTSDSGANTIGRTWHNLRQSFGASTAGVYGAAALVNAASGGDTIPVNQVVVPASRTFKLIPKSSGLVGDKARGIAEGDAQPFAWDFANDLPTNGRLASVDSVEIVDGTTGGLTFAATATDPGVDKTLGIVTVTAVTADTYTVRMTVTYQDGEGGGTRSGDVEIVVTE